MFQFHKGSIRTHRTHKKRGDLLCFNSIKVQLELPGVTYLLNISMFQFHKGSIRTSGSRTARNIQDVSIP